jgi:site-specific DNA-methyltransferase (adenine-specific)
MTVTGAAKAAVRSPSPTSAPKSSTGVSTVAAPATQVYTKYWEIHQGDFRANSHLVASNSVDLVYTDLPFAVGLDTFSKHAKGTISYGDDRDDLIDMLPTLCSETYRVLREDRYAVFFFGFNYYTELLSELQTAGLSYQPVPVVWYKHTRSTENPNTRYANAYDAAVIAWKGSPCLLRPGQTNHIDIPAIKPMERLQIAQQPVALVDRFLQDMTAPGATVVDWMCGSGTTGEACVKSKRYCILFEQSPLAYSVAKTRLEAL